MKAIVVNDDGTEEDDMSALVGRRLEPQTSPTVRSSQVTPLPIAISSSSNTTATDSSIEALSMPSSSSSRAPAAKTRARRDSNHIPRPPNAFILFRSAFIRSQQIPDRVEGNHSNLSKIIGHYWKSLSSEERAEWEAKAVEAQEEHRQKYPDWRFRPGPYAVGKPKIKEAGPKRSAANTPKETPEDHESPPSQSAKKKDGPEPKTRGKGKGKEKDGASGRSVPEKRERRDSRCEKIASLIVAGKTGADLASAVEEWEGNPSLSTSSQLPSSSTSKLGKSPNRSGHGSPQSTSHLQHQSSQANPSTKPKPPIKGISEVPLTQMFVTDRPSRPSVPAIAEANSLSPYDRSPLTTSSVSSSSSSALPNGTSRWRHDDSSDSPTLPYHGGSSPGSDGPYWWNPDGSPSVPVPNISFLEKDRSTGQRQQAATLGYEPSQGVDTWNRGFDKYGHLDDLPPDGSEVGSWACGSTQGRQGLMAMIPDPCVDQDTQVSLGQPGAVLPESHPPPTGYSDLPPLSLAPHHPVSAKTHAHNSGSGISIRTTPTMGSPSMPTSFFNQPYQPPTNLHQHQHHSQDPSSPQLLLPPTSYSTLTGWAGEYDYDPSLSSAPLSSKTGMSSNGYQQHHRSLSDSLSSPSNNGFGWQNGGTVNPSHTWPDLHGGHNLGLARAPDEWEESDSGVQYNPHLQDLSSS